MAREEVNFTKAVINSEVAPESGRSYLYDSKETGLVLQPTEKGRKTFQLYKKHLSRPLRITLGIWRDMTVEQARKKARDAKVELAAGNNPNDALRREREEMTFADLFVIYPERHSKQRKSTWQEDQRYYDRHLAATLGKKKLSTITRKDISLVHAKIGKTRQVHSNRVLTLVSSVFGRAIEFGLWEGINPCLGIKKFKEQSRDRFLSADELTRFF